CEQWRVRDLLNHMLDTQRYFASTARGEDASPPSPTPPSLLSSDPAADFAKARTAVIQGFARDGVIEKTGPSLGIAFSDQLLHGWDLAQATNQDATMPSGLAEAAYQMIHGRFTDEQRKGVFKPEVQLGRDVSPQDRLLGYSGRDPSSQASS
ncbi:MAG TPA: TIGR03086 family metal-binding protein, partial [Acidimicrobiia bacterium]